MAVEMVFPRMSGSLRVLFLGAMTSAWYEAGEEARRDQVLPRFKQLTQEWLDLGATPLATLDDDLLMVGQPVSTGYTFFLMFEVERLETVVEMIQRLREPVDGVRMDTYARFEARVGRPFFLLEPPAEPSAG
ncbi:MAG TPA: hypothetical protein VIQ56_08015 [Gaiella sp.]|jgi:hypothetical protein